MLIWCAIFFVAVWTTSALKHSITLAGMHVDQLARLLMLLQYSVYLLRLLFPVQTDGGEKEKSMPSWHHDRSLITIDSLQTHCLLPWVI